MWFNLVFWIRLMLLLLKNKFFAVFVQFLLLVIRMKFICSILILILSFVSTVKRLSSESSSKWSLKSKRTRFYIEKLMSSIENLVFFFWIVSNYEIDLIIPFSINFFQLFISNEFSFVPFIISSLTCSESKIW